MKYRPEIDGLRAIAVLPVILSHIAFPGFAGGYVGVDIFFVISGFLITTTILSDVENNRFSPLKFFERRARRILPALFFVLISSFALMWLVMTPAGFKDYSNSLIAASLSVSNFYFLRSIDYFAAAASETPLLHTWSLAVEEQFYLLFPLLFLFVASRRKQVCTIVVIAALSFVLCLVGSQFFLSESYYLLPTRAWELLAGALLAYLVRSKQLPPHPALSALGVALILGSIFGLDEGVVYPSAYTLLPVAGAALFIGFASQAEIVGRSLANPVAIWIGKLSFSAYLWHQIIFVFWRLSGQDTTAISTKIGLVILVFAAAALTYGLVERPLRYINLSFKGVARATVAVGTLCVALGVWGAVGKGLPFRMSPEFNSFYDDLKWSRECLTPVQSDVFDLPVQGCVIGPSDAKLKIALWGDSVSAAVAPAVMELFPSSDTEFSRLFYGGCAPIDGVYTAARDLTKYCGAVIDRGLAYLLSGDFDAVILGAAWVEFFGSPSHYIDRAAVSGDAEKLQLMRRRFEATIEQILSKGIKVILIEPMAMVDFHPADRMARRINLAAEFASVSISRSEFDANVSRAAEGLAVADRSGFYRVDPRDAFCSDECYLGENGESYLFDRVHYS